MTPPNDENEANGRVANVDAASAAAASADSTSTKPVSAAANKNQDDDRSTLLRQQTVCRFLVTNINSERRSTINLTVDLLVERDGLLDLAQTVFEAGLKKHGKCKYSSLKRLLWDLSFGGLNYKNGWLREPYLDGPAAPRYIDKQDRRILQQLKRPLKVGMSGHFSCNHAMCTSSFDFQVQSLQDVTSTSTSDDDQEAHPIAVTEIKLNFNNKLECDFLSDAEQQTAFHLRQQYEAYFAGDNEWRLDPRTPEYIHTPRKPLRAPWRDEEIELFVMLQHAGSKFKKSWNAILQFGLIDRTENASSCQWYKVLKDPYGFMTRGLSKDQAMAAAKVLAKTRLDRFATKPVPELGPFPPDYPYERALLLCCQDSDYDSDGASPQTKRAKIAVMKERHDRGELPQVCLDRLDQCRSGYGGVYYS